MRRLVLGLTALLAGCTAGAPAPAATPAPDRPAPIVLVSIDGFRWDYIDRPAAATIRRLASRGVHARTMEPVFPSKTFPNHYTLVTGLHPDHHGIIANTMEDPALGRFTLSDRDQVRNPAWWGGEPIWVTAERAGLRTAAFFWPGSEAPIRGVWPTWWREFDNSVPHTERVASVLDWLRLPADSMPVFITLYFSDVDDAGHRHGPGAAETDSAIARVDRSVAQLWAGIERLGMADRVTLLLTSDHGMAATSPDRVIVLDDHLEPGSYRVVDWTPVAAIVPADGREDEVVDRLRAVPHLTVWRRGQVPDRFQFGTHPRVTPVVALADPGWVITSRAGRSRYASGGGDHGYDNRAPDMGALFVGLGPGLAAGRTVDRVRSVDVYSLMAHLLGLRAVPGDGSLDSIRTVLRPR